MQNHERVGCTPDPCGEPGSYQIQQFPAFREYRQGQPDVMPDTVDGYLFVPVCQRVDGEAIPVDASPVGNLAGDGRCQRVQFSHGSCANLPLAT